MAYQSSTHAPASPISDDDLIHLAATLVRLLAAWLAQRASADSEAAGGSTTLTEGVAL